MAADAGTLPVLILSGTIGAGKTTTGSAVHDILADRQVPHAFLDVDRLTDAWPQHGPFNQDTAFEALSALWPVYRRAGAKRLVLAYVVESREELARYETVLGACAVTVVRLNASAATLERRIKAREAGKAQQWHLQRASELSRVLDTAQPYDFAVYTDGRAPHEIAAEVLRRAAWSRG